MSRTMAAHAWFHHEERIASLPGAIDVGVGDDAVHVTGLSSRDLGSRVRMVFHDLIDGGANLILVGEIQLYVRRRGRSVDVGTRQDFAALGWEMICDLLDARSR